MQNHGRLTNRRSFLSGAALAAGTGAMSLLTVSAMAAPDAKDEFNIIGPKKGYSPQVGTLVSMLEWVQPGVTRPVKGLTQENLDYLIDANANSIGALLLHLAATETYYGLRTFQGMKWGSFPEEASKKWDAAMELGDAGRKTIKGHDLTFYLDTLKETREKTLAEFRKKDDAWLMAADKDWPWGPTNNY